MRAHQISYKLWFSGGEGLGLEDFIPVFHGWIRERRLDNEVMIDVADYAHVPDGPGVLLVCHEGHYVIEHYSGRWALSYHRKRGGETDALERRLAVPLRRLAAAAQLLEGDPELSGKVRFETEAIELAVRNRLLAPNTPETFVALRPALEAFLGSRLGGGELELEHRDHDPRALFTVRVRVEATASLDDLAA